MDAPRRGGGSGRGRGGGRGRRRGRGDGNCYNCGQPGHISRDCPQGPGAGAKRDTQERQHNGGVPKHTRPRGGGVASGAGATVGGGFKMQPVLPPAAAAKAGGGQGGSGKFISSTTKAHLTDKRFDELPVSDNSIRALHDVMQYQVMTQVQLASLPVILDGHDVLARAKTGTGKTVAFLLPAVELMVKSGRAARSDISVLIMSPTRELASQILAEANQIVTHHPFKTLCVFGGTNIKTDHRKLQGQVDILVATPGRLLDHLKNSPGFSQRLGNLQVLIFDEADQLLEMGFQPSIRDILSRIPPKHTRQTLLFSATVPPKVKEVSKIALKDAYKFIDCVGEEQQATNQQIAQQLVAVPLEERAAVLFDLIEQERQLPDHKIIAFFSTARETGFMSMLYQQATGNDAYELHSRKSQSYRTKTSEKFRRGTNCVLFTSDVSARGMDYPDVTFVIQVGITTREQYIHRVGRTGRAGRQGHATLLLASFEERAMKSALRSLPLVPTPYAVSDAMMAQYHRGTAAVDGRGGDALRLAATQCYQAWLGFYNSNLRMLGWDKPFLVQQANRFALIMGLREPPALQKRTVGKMGLRGTPGLRVE